MPRDAEYMHTHFGALVIGGTFLGVLLAGTLWRLSAMYFMTSPNPLLQQLGKAGMIQY